MSSQIVQPDPDLVALVAAMSGDSAEHSDRRVSFRTDTSFVVGTIDAVTSRIVIRAFLDGVDDEEATRQWVDRQPPPASGVLDVAELETEPGRTEHQPALAFERPSRHDWTGDPLVDEVQTYQRAWDADQVAEPVAAGVAWTVPDDPRAAAPESAWLLFGSETSYPSEEELSTAEAGATVGMFIDEWTASSTTRRGDLLLFYFTAPRKAVHFIARAASDAHFVRGEDPDNTADFNPTQWWVDITPMIEVEPIPLDHLLDATGGGLVLRSRSGIFMQPLAITRLQFRAVDPGRQAEVDRIADTPTGLADLPAPETMTFEQWRGIASGALKLEAHVSSHIVEPLLRWLIADRDFTYAREYKIGKRLADFVILDGEGRPIHVIEVKKRIRSAPRQSWEETPDFAQVRWYADHLGVAATLIDAQRLMLVDHLGGEPTRILTRRELESTDLDDLRAHVLGPSATVRYRIFNVMDHSQTTFGTIETSSDGVVRSFVRDDGRATDVFQAEIRAGLTLAQVKGSFRNYAFIPKG